TIQNIETPPLATAGYNHSFLLDSIDTAAEDPTVQAIVLKVDSPGGGVTESAEIHRKTTEFQAVYANRVYVSMRTTASCGGYYVSAAADRLFANESTLTGSIGVMMQSMKFSGLAEKYRIEFNTIKSGTHKDIM